MDVYLIDGTYELFRHFFAVPSSKDAGGQEIGIRMALGADRGNVVRMVLAGASKRVLAGLILGVPLAIGAGRLISAQLYGVSSWDPMALGIAAIALAISAFFAAVIPARRAASISPMKALRTE